MRTAQTAFERELDPVILAAFLEGAGDDVLLLDAREPQAARVPRSIPLPVAYLELRDRFAVLSFSLEILSMAPQSTGARAQRALRRYLAEPIANIGLGRSSDSVKAGDLGAGSAGLTGRL
jgi:hypothetical protein